MVEALSLRPNLPHVQTLDVGISLESELPQLSWAWIIHLPQVITESFTPGHGRIRRWQMIAKFMTLGNLIFFRGYRLTFGLAAF
jgi:hypothetical protein